MNYSYAIVLTSMMFKVTTNCLEYITLNIQHIKFCFIYSYNNYLTV